MDKKRKEIKLLLFIDNIIVHMENTKKSTKNSSKGRINDQIFHVKRLYIITNDSEK